MMTPRTDSGAGSKQRADPSSHNSNKGSRFDKVLGDTLTDTQPQPPVAGNKKPQTAIDPKNAAPGKIEKPDNQKKIDETLAAGIMGNQETAVFILEGDKDSATPPEVNVDAAAAVGEVPAEIAPLPIELPADKTEVKPEQEKQNLPDVTMAPVTPDEPKASDEAVANTVADQADAVETPVIAVQKKDVGKNNPVDEKADAEKEPVNNIKEEVTARMPDIRTSERQENNESKPEFSDNGGLSPLENENDKASVKGQKEKTYSETANAAQNNADAAKAPASDTLPPLTAGIKPEQFIAGQQMKQAATDVPVKRENLFEEMVSRIETMQTESSSTMTIQLKPEFLGKVALEIAMDATGLHVRIDAANSDVRTMINGQINALIESLQNKGIEVADVEVAYTGVNNGTFKDPRENQAQPDQQRRSYRKTDPADGAAFYAALPIDTLEYYLDAGVSSVEYSA